MHTIDEARFDEELLLARRGRGGLIRQGSRNPAAVKALQQRLSDLGYNTEVDGLFGHDTYRQLRHFQQDKGARVDGVVGKETLGKLMRAKPDQPNASDPSIDAITKVVAPGASTAKTTSSQGVRSALGRQSAASTRTGQSKTGKTATGSSASTTPKGAHGGTIDKATGKETATAATGPIGSTKPPTAGGYSFEEAHPRGGAGTPEGGKFVKKGDSGQLVTNSQAALNHTGNYNLKTDGQFGPKTETAVKAFQQKHSLTVDGIVGPQTSGALRRQLHAIRDKQSASTSTSQRRTFGGRA